jgi:chemotaxis response regulator CheB
MPRAAIEAGAAERVLPLPAIADAIIDAVSHRARRS